MLTMYGIKNCDTIKKARTWLDNQHIAYDFHDYKTQGIDRDHLQAWCKAFGWERVLNRAGTTFKKLPELDKTDLDESKAVALMLAQPSMIKRPIVEGTINRRKVLLIGFKADDYRSKLH